MPSSFPEVIGKEIEKAAERVYPLQNVLIRKVKLLRAPKSNIEKLLELHGGADAAGSSAPVTVQPSEAATTVAEDTGKTVERS